MKKVIKSLFVFILLFQFNISSVFAQEVDLTEEYMLGIWEVDVEAYELELRKLSEENDIPLEEEQLQQILENVASQAYECQMNEILLVSTGESQIEGNWRVDIPQKKLFLRFNLDAAELPVTITKVEQDTLHFQDNQMGITTVWTRVLD